MGLRDLWSGGDFPSPAPEFFDVILLCLFFNQPILFHPGIVMLLFDRFNEVITHAFIFSTELSGVIRIFSTMNATDNLICAAS
ncbi:TPA: hypothetical protein ACSW2U_002415 [Enterobacter roggenkampii]